MTLLAGRAREYCWSHFLAPNTLEMMSEMRRQFGRGSYSSVSQLNVSRFLFLSH
jgi:hypothetical protein